MIYYRLLHKDCSKKKKELIKNKEKLFFVYTSRLEIIDKQQKQDMLRGLKLFLSVTEI